MALPAPLLGCLRLPVVAAPMFLVSGPELVVACCRAGVLGSFPALNQRSTAGFVAWLKEIGAALGSDDAPFAVNLIVHRSNARLEADLAAIVAHRVPVVITSLEPSAVVAFGPEHVAGIALREEEVSFDVALKAVVSDKVGATSGPPGWAGFDQPLDRVDSGWAITAGDEPDGYFDDDAHVEAVGLGELVQRYPALVEVFQAGEGEWVYRPDHRRYVRLKKT